jgi:predicted O-methyltransferase YrrM
MRKSAAAWANGAPRTAITIGHNPLFDMIFVVDGGVPVDRERTLSQRMKAKVPKGVRSRLLKVQREARTTHLAVSNTVRRRDYPAAHNIREPNRGTVEFLRGISFKNVAEIGIYLGHTSFEIATQLGNEGELHLFDFEERVDAVADQLESQGYTNVHRHGSTHRTYDSYNWELMKLLQSHPEPFLDYVFLDGAHTWCHDALAFCLVDRLLVPGGYMDFDDYSWSHQTSKALNPRVFPKTRRDYTGEQVKTRQIELMIFRKYIDVTTQV